MRLPYWLLRQKWWSFKHRIRRRLGLAPIPGMTLDQFRELEAGMRQRACEMWLSADRRKNPILKMFDDEGDSHGQA